MQPPSLSIMIRTDEEVVSEEFTSESRLKAIFSSRLRLCEDNQKFHVVNHTINCPIHFITSNWNTITLLTNYVLWPSTVVSDAMTRTLTTWSFLKGSSYTSGYASQTSQRTQPVKNKDKTRIILLSRIQKLTVSTLNGGHWLPPLTQ